MIQRALDENDEIILGVTGYDMDRGKDFIPFLRRVQLMTRIYGENRRIHVSQVDDRKLGLTGTFSERAWRTWSAELFRNAGEHGVNPFCRNHRFTWYTGEDRYIEKLRAIYPSHGFVKLDRQVIPVSGTEIRENPKKYTRYVSPLFIKYLNDNHPELGLAEP